jgi:hypothetical protein
VAKNGNEYEYTNIYTYSICIGYELILTKRNTRCPVPSLLNCRLLSLDSNRSIQLPKAQLPFELI